MSCTQIPPRDRAAASRAAAQRPRDLVLLVVLAVTLGLALLAPSSAIAAFSQSFRYQLTRAEANSHLTCRSESPPSPLCSVGGGVAFDSTDNLWVSSGEEALSGFDKSGGFVETLTLEKNLSYPTHLAIERATGHFYIVGAERAHGGEDHVEVFDNKGKRVALPEWNRYFGNDAYVAVDNATEPVKDPSACGTSPLLPAECSVYVSHESQDPGSPYGDGLGKGVEKFSSSGAPVNFTSSGSCTTPTSYVKGNEITGTPTESFEFGVPGSVAVGSEGQIYVVNRNGKEGVPPNQENAPQVDEYRPCGEFVRAFTGTKTPGLGGDHGEGGWGGRLEGVAVDPASGLLAVSLINENQSEGAVDEFAPSSGALLNQITETEVEVSPGNLEKSHLYSAFGMTFDSQGDLYVVDSYSKTINEKAIDAYGPGRYVPSFRLAEATERESESAVLNDQVNPESSLDPERPKPALTECHFQYVTEAAFRAEGFKKPIAEPECEEPSAPEVAGDGWTKVHAGIGGLVSGTTYYYRLAAKVAGALGGPGYSKALAFTAPAPPRVDSASATNLSSTFADLYARIDPLGADTAYHFEYSPDGINWIKAPVPDAPIGSGGATGNVDASVVRQIGGLAPGTTYHFRVFASNRVGESEETEKSRGAFTTLPAPILGLPDNRAYELVTPPDKEGSSDMFGLAQTSSEFVNNDVGYPSQDGSHFLLETAAAFGPFPATGRSAYRFTRVPPAPGGQGGEWTYSSLASPSLGVQATVQALFNPVDFSRVGFEDGVGSTASEEGSQRMNLVGPPGGPYTTLHRDAPTQGGGAQTEIVGASHDLGHLILESTTVAESASNPLCLGAETQDPRSHMLCEWSGGGLKLVNFKPDGTLFQCGAGLGEGQGGSTGSGATPNAVSYDGSRIFFTAPDPSAKGMGPGCWNLSTNPQTNPPELYMRSGGKTVKVSAPEEGVSDPTGEHPAVYVGAAEDGSKVFFLTEAELTANDEGIHDPELYEYDTETGALTRISAGESGEAAADVAYVPAVSAGGSTIYFAALGRLTSAAPAVGGEQVNLYRYDTEKRTTTYVATVNEIDYPDPAGVLWGGGALRRRGAIALDSGADWYTTPDGRYLLFASKSELTGYDSVEASAGDCPGVSDQAENNGHCAELYRYDARAAERHEEPIVCVSCDPTGAPPVSNALFARSAPTPPAASPVRAMSDDGSYVFFDTADGLVSTDGNNTLDVYQWHAGRVSLISSGKDKAPSFFLGASPDGSNVFFGTHAKLVPQDTDTNGDIYDARVCTKEDPCITPPSGGTGQCEGDACQSPPSAPIDATPGSLTFSGAGNVPGEVKTQVKPKAKPTNAQKLTTALKACGRKPKRQRKRCRSQAYRRYAGKPAKPARARHAKPSGRAGR
jgi:hypothetical protein